MHGRPERAGFVCSGFGLLPRHIGRVGFWRGGEMYHGLRQMQLCFGRTDEMHRVFRGVGNQERCWIGKPDVLGGGPHQAAGDEE